MGFLEVWNADGVGAGVVLFDLRAPPDPESIRVNLGRYLLYRIFFLSKLVLFQGPRARLNSFIVTF